MSKATVPDIKALFAAGAHFGHRSSRWHPKMAPYIHSKRGGIHIIDLVKTEEALKEALKFVESIAAQGRKILIVGTKRQTKELTAKIADSCDMPYVSERWLGGMLTNFATISERVKRLKTLESQLASGELQSKYSKLEVQRIEEEIAALRVTFGGIADMEALPAAIFVLDIHTEPIAVHEARKLNLPIVGIVDTNTDPSDVDFCIPANDDAIKTLELIGGAIAEAINIGKSRFKPTAEDATAKTITKKAV